MQSNAKQSRPSNSLCLSQHAREDGPPAGNGTASLIGHAGALGRSRGGPRQHRRAQQRRGPQAPSAKHHRSCYLMAPPVMPLMKRSRKRLYAIATGTLAISAAPISSEERRVGKECRYAWTPFSSKKKKPVT